MSENTVENTVADIPAAAGTEDSVLLMTAADIVCAYVSNNQVPVADLPTLIGSVLAAVRGQVQATAPAVTAEKPVPAVPVEKSVTRDRIICLEDGESFKSLKRHLREKYDMTPDQYRAKWDLPADYPMVAPEYSERRAAMAKSNGLGRKRKDVVEVKAAA